MQIQQTTAKAAFASPATANLALKRQAEADIARDMAADRSSISQEAQDRLASEAANGPRVPSSRVYRVAGPVYRLEDLGKSKGEPLITAQMTEAQINETRLRAQQDEARRAVNFDYAQAHPYKPVGQVIANGELVATVFDAGAIEAPHTLPKLSQENLSPADRLAEIARAVKGKIIYSDFLPTTDSWMGSSAPESMLPPVTARSLREIFDQEIAPAMEKKISEWELQTGKKHPSRAA